MLMPELRSRTPGFTWNHDEIVWRDVRSWNKLATQDQDEAHWYNRTEFWKEEAKKGKGGTVVKSWCPPTAATKKPSFALCVSKKEWARYQAFLDDMEMKALEEERNQVCSMSIGKKCPKCKDSRLKQSLLRISRRTRPNMDTRLSRLIRLIRRDGSGKQFVVVALSSGMTKEWTGHQRKKQPRTQVRSSPEF